MIKSTGSQKEAETLREQQKEVESKDLAAAEIEKWKKHYQTEHDKNMNMMAEMVIILFPPNLCILATII